jgi:hypothetical protein
MKGHIESGVVSKIKETAAKISSQLLFSKGEDSGHS